MPSFGWRELALLLVVLSALTLLLVPGDPNADPGRPASASTNENAASRQETAASPPIAFTASREAVPAVRPSEPPPATPSRPPVVPRADGAYEARSVPEARNVPEREAASPVSGRPPTNPAPVAAPVPEPSPAEKFWVGCANPTSFSGDGRIFFPLPGAHLDSYENTWGAPRPQGGHEGTDLMVPAGTPELAVTDGTLVAVAGSNANGWNSLGGYAVMLRADHSVGPIKAGDLFYYAHMNAMSQLPIGAKVRAGQVLGYAGDTGQGPEVTRGLFPPHLHFGWYDVGDAGDAGGTRSVLPSGAINPYPMLEWIEANGAAGGSDAGRCAAPGVGAPVPSDAPPPAEGRWPADASPGLGPDLDTGSGTPNPTPIPAPAPAPGAREVTPHRTIDDAKESAPAQHTPPTADKPTRAAATPEPQAGKPEREPSASAAAGSAAAGPGASATAGQPVSAVAGPAAPAKPPQRPTPGLQTQTPQPPEPAKPEPTHEPAANIPDSREPGGQKPGAVNPSKPVEPVPPVPVKPVPPSPSGPVAPAPGDDPLSRTGSSSKGIEEPKSPGPDAPAGPNPGMGNPSQLPDEREDDTSQEEYREATGAAQAVVGEEVPAGTTATATATAEPAER